jgi:Putative prokaryotic signal transducing protein
MTTVTRLSLIENFALLSDDELWRMLGSDELTDLARDVAGRELRSRGIDLAKPPGGAENVPSPEDPMEADDEVAASDGNLVLLARFHNPIDGQMLRGRLDAEGVPAFVADAHMAQANPLLAMAVGGVRVLVPERYLARGQEILRDIRAGRYALDDQVDVGPCT